jgi:N-acetylglucosaminyldiphosphoundecaprenol N-acetyl-beta-D-mannosaminyltransferase
MERSNKEFGRVFFLGSSVHVLSLIQKKTNEDYPNITLDSYSPPFKDNFSDEDNKIMVDKINAFNPDIIFVGMTCPKQEKWAYLNKKKIKRGLIVCIGNVFDWYAGTQKKYILSGLN